MALRAAGRLALAAGRYLLHLPGELAALAWWALDLLVVLIVVGLVLALGFPHTLPGRLAAEAGRHVVQWLWLRAPWLFIKLPAG